MTIYHGNKREEYKTKEQDKGHRNHLIEFAKYMLKDETSTIPSFEEFVKSTIITFAVDRLIKSSLPSMATGNYEGFQGRHRHADSV